MLGFVPLPNLPKSLFRLEGESGKCVPISLTTLGHPTVLACGSTALLTLSGVWLKLAPLTNLSGTNLDADGAQRVSGMDATNQTLASLRPDHSSSAQTGI